MNALENQQPSQGQPETVTIPAVISQIGRFMNSVQSLVHSLEDALNHRDQMITGLMAENNEFKKMNKPDSVA